MKATLIMKNGMSIELDNPKEVQLNGLIIDDLEVLVDCLTTGTNIVGAPINDIKLKHIFEDAEGEAHTFNYRFKLDAFNWGYTYAKD